MQKHLNLVTITRAFALLMGIAFTAAGIAGFLPVFTRPAPVDAPSLSLSANYGLLLGLFPVNIVHNFFHLGVGIFGLSTFRNYSTARTFSRSLGIALGILTIMGMLPYFKVGFGFLPLYGHDIWFHGLEAVAGIYLGFFVGESMQQAAIKAV